VTRREFHALGAIALPVVPLRAAASANQLTDAEKREGWKLLFDGKSSDGWLEITGKAFPSKCWAIEDGCLRTIVRQDGMQDIRTVENYKSFDFRFDWMARKDGNSGVKYLIQKVDEWVNKEGRQARARGLEYQLADDAGPDASTDRKRIAGSLYSVIAPASHQAPAVGVFHESRIVLNGTHAEHWLDGVKLVSFETTAPEVVAHLKGDRTEGPISLQNHQSEVWFRNIRVRRLQGFV
jgi:hypothetical protein